MYTAFDYYKTIYDSIVEIYPAEEARAIAFYLLESKYSLSKNDVLSHKPMQSHIHNSLKKHVVKLMQYHPVQYLAGQVTFFDLPIKVNKSVLIPRPETEELVRLILENEDINNVQTWLDVGTGSGCIALALSKAASAWQLYGIDASVKAVLLARKNAQLLGLQVDFKQRNIFGSDLDFIPLGSLDGIVSNPPYIPAKDKAIMAKNVVDYEPSLALFVPDNDPLIFYRRIAEVGKYYLKPNGKLYFEIYEYFGQDIKKLLADYGYKSVSVFPDFNNKVRFAVATNA